ncbi:MAG: J domain-containing protein [Ostreibacterium sp.]
MNLIRYESKNISNIRFDIICLIKKLATIETDIAEFHSTIEEFNREYQYRLGDLAKSVLVLRQQLGLDESGYTKKNITMQLATSDYCQLKIAYRKAAKLCHPDRLPNNYRQIGLQLFDTINKAYQLQDLVTIEHILWLLETKQAFTNTTVIITDPKLLIKRKALLVQMIEQKKDQLTQFKNQENDDVSNSDNWNSLLYDYQIQLEDELALLRHQINAKKCSNPL